MKKFIGLFVGLLLIVSCSQKEIRNFDECVATGNPVMESFPEQCRANGETFVRSPSAMPPVMLPPQGKEGVEVGMPVPDSGASEVVVIPSGKMMPVPSNEPLPPAVQAAKDYVEAKTNNSAIVLNVQKVDWPDGCIGIIDPAATCLMAITPGYNITVYSGESEYEIHTTENGDVVREAGRRVTGALAI